MCIRSRKVNEVKTCEGCASAAHGAARADCWLVASARECRRRRSAADHCAAAAAASDADAVLAKL